MRGVPVRLEVGPKDVANTAVMSVRRDTRGKESIPLASLAERLPALLAEVQASLFEQAKAFRDANTVLVQSKAEVIAHFAGEKRGFVAVPWDGSRRVRGRGEGEVRRDAALHPARPVAVRAPGAARAPRGAVRAGLLKARTAPIRTSDAPGPRPPAELARGRAHGAAAARTRCAPALPRRLHRRGRSGAAARPARGRPRVGRGARLAARARRARGAARASRPTPRWSCRRRSRARGSRSGRVRGARTGFAARGPLAAAHARAAAPAARRPAPFARVPAARRGDRRGAGAAGRAAAAAGAGRGPRGRGRAGGRSRRCAVRAARAGRGLRPRQALARRRASRKRAARLAARGWRLFACGAAAEREACDEVRGGVRGGLARGPDDAAGRWRRCARGRVGGGEQRFGAWRTWRPPSARRPWRCSVRRAARGPRRWARGPRWCSGAGLLAVLPRAPAGSATGASRR